MQRIAAIFVSLLILCFAVRPGSAQSQKPPAGRKVVHRITPEYPRSLKDAHIGGVVRLYLTVSSRGDVSKVAPLGGNPILVEAATKAVLNWKYIPAASQSNEQVQIEFK